MIKQALRKKIIAKYNVSGLELSNFLGCYVVLTSYRRFQGSQPFHIQAPPEVLTTPENKNLSTTAVNIPNLRTRFSAAIPCSYYLNAV